MKNLIIIFKSLVVLILLSNYSYSVVTVPSPASSSVLSQISSSMSHSAVNSNNIIINSNNVTSSVISSTQLKEEIKETAAELGLEVDENAAEILSDESSDQGSSKDIAAAMESLQDNITELDHDFVMTMDENTMVYDSGWMDLEKVTTGSNGLSYSIDKNVFQDGVSQQGRGKVYVNFNKGVISADMYTRITLKGDSQISHQWNSGAAGINAIPVVASTVRALNSDGTTDFDEFVDVNSSMQVDSDTLAPNFTCEGCFTKQNQMDRFNHDTSNGDAEKRVFMYGKFITTTPSGESGTGTIVLEGAHDAAAAATDDGTTTYIGTIERFEGSATIVGSALK